MATPGRSRAASLPLRRFRVVVTDVDGTLTGADRRLVPRAMSAVRWLESHGIPVVLATGNVLPIALGLHRSLGLSGPIVAENGGLLYRTVDGQERIERLADRRVALEAYRALLAAGLPVRRLFTDRWRETEVGLEPTVPLARIRRVLALRGIPVQPIATGFAIHLMERGAGKLPALRRALRPMGLRVTDCVVLGDGDNDVGMLRASGFGVSFASGSPRARRAARYVARSSFADGFVEGLKASGIMHRRRSSPGGELASARRPVRAVRITRFAGLYRLRTNVLSERPRRGRACLLGLRGVAQEREGPRVGADPSFAAPLARPTPGLGPGSVVDTGQDEPSFRGRLTHEEQSHSDRPGHQSESERSPGVRPDRVAEPDPGHREPARGREHVQPEIQHHAEAPAEEEEGRSREEVARAFIAAVVRRGTSRGLLEVDHAERTFSGSIGLSLDACYVTTR